ncbi:MAG: hypothetical protein ACE3L7_33585 [Candidatus Pristimantibacillus sp.]
MNYIRGGVFLDYTKEEFERMLNLIADDYVLVRSKFELYCKMTEVSDLHNELMSEISPGFFTLVFDALISDIFINLTKLIDHKDEAVGTIYTLILDSNNSKDLFRHKNRITEIYKARHQRELRRQGKVLSKVQYIRNKKFAHLDPIYQLDRQKIIEDKFISFNDLREVFVVLHRVLNHYHQAFFGRKLDPFAKNATDVIKLMEAMAYYKQGYIRETNVNLLAAGLMPSKTGRISMDDLEEV